MHQTLRIRWLPTLRNGGQEWRSCGTIPTTNASFVYFPYSPLSKNADREDSHSPNPLVSVGLFDYIMYLTSHPLLTPSERELAILAVGAHTGSVYELYAHSLIAKKIGLSDVQIKAATEGKVPEGLSEREKGVFEFSISLLERRGPLEKEMFEKVAEEMGKDRLLILIQLVSAYSYVCLMMNAGAVGVPEDVGESLET